ncbi:MAG: nucleotide sugar dehydrogenase [Ardenticatenaceae bacterium]|nr:nucleotide sugar dehydrogenase [Ardenticatenaceae bacterium]MCB9005505.1 nucleotide sugar dehydrogenase [Ardenticatenaceae bacterium]
MNNKQELLHKFESQQAKLGIVGMGYVGLPLAVAFAKVGFEVVGLDVIAEKVAMLNQGHSYVEDVPDAELAPLIEKGLIRATTDYADLADVDAISICVPTPLRKTKDPDISYIISAADSIVAHAGGTGKLIVLESTTYPGTTEEIVLPRLSDNGDKVGQEFFLAFSPERVDPGRTDYNMFNTPKVFGGVTPDCLEVTLALYSQVVEHPVPVSSTAAAEMVKLLENTFRAVNIALVNEVAVMCDKLGLNVWEVVEAAATKPYGFMKFTPGPGVGGHCIPLDPHYLSWKLKTVNYNARFIELASEINSHMPDYVVTKVADALNGDRKAINGSRILVLGVSYKPNVGDVRESPALDIILLLQGRGAEVVYHDPYVEDLSHEGVDCARVELTAETLQTADCVVVVTNHKAYDWAFVGEQAGLIVDTRNALQKQSARGQVISL